jgi:hypothetical protein
MEQPDTRRPLAGLPLSSDPLQEPHQASRVAAEGDRLTVFGQATRLLQRQPRLATACSADYGEPVLVTQESHDAGLVFGHLPDALLMLRVKGEYVRRRQAGPGKQASHFHRRGNRQGRASVSVQFEGTQQLVDDLLQVLPVDQESAG